MELDAGLDRSGTANLNETDGNRNIYVVCLAAVENREALREGLATLRRQIGMKENSEFRGYDSSAKVQLDFLRTVDSIGLRIGALIIDKEKTRRQFGGIGIPSSTEFELLASWTLLERFFALHSVARLWCDEDIKGKQRQQEFRTKVQRLHSIHQPGKQIRVRHVASDSIDLIQVADMVGYGFARVARGGVLQPEIQEILESIRKETHNVVLGPMAWEKEG